ncbi:MAG: HAD family phosphatase [Spirochaetia bacterium]|jgi:putative hydrolase of the HAD superfamily
MNLLPLRIRALIYDFDNTIVGTERINEQLFNGLLLGEFGVFLSPPEQEILHGLPWSGVFDWLEENRLLGGRRPEIWSRFMEVKRESLRRRKPAVATGLDLMFALPVPQAIVTGSSREELEMVMEAIGMSENGFAAILCDEDCARGKPDPEGYLRALEKLRVAAAEALVFEDSRPGIAAARMAGITVAFISELASRDRGADADVCFGSFTEAWAAVKDRADGRGDRGDHPAVRK